MDQLQLFTYADKYPFNVILIDGNPHFVGKEICDALGYKNHNDAMNDHCRGVAKRYPIADALGRVQETRIISEPDMLRLIVNSKLPSAQEFEAWVFEDVLPSIRKTGRYGVSKIPEDFESALRLAADQQKEIKRLALQAELDAPKVAFAEAVETRAEEKSLQAVARHFNKPPNNFIVWLAEQGLIFKRQQFGAQQSFWEPKAFMSVGGYITLRQEMCQDGRTRPQAKVSGKGLAYISRLLEQKGFP